MQEIKKSNLKVTKNEYYNPQLNAVCQVRAKPCQAIHRFVKMKLKYSVVLTIQQYFCP